MMRVLAFYQYDEADLPWAHPIDGVVAYVDLTERFVTKVIDEHARTLSGDNFDACNRHFVVRASRFYGAARLIPKRQTTPLLCRASKTKSMPRRGAPL